MKRGGNVVSLRSLHNVEQMHFFPEDVKSELQVAFSTFETVVDSQCYQNLQEKEQVIL